RYLTHLHQRENAFLHTGPATGATHENHRQHQLRRRFHRSRQLFADDRPHAPRHEGEVGHPEYHWPTADVPPADNGGVRHPRFGLLRLQALRIGDAIFEFQPVDGANVGEPFFEAVLVQELADPVPGRPVKVVLALRANVEPALGFLTENRRLALRTADPQSLG